MKFRLIDTGKKDAFSNMAIDESLMKLSPLPVLRLYQWKTAVSLGSFQKIKDIDIRYCKKNDIDIVRRLSGGKAVFHDKELTYSFIIDEKFMPKSVTGSYKKISGPILKALNNLGINAKFKDDNVKKDNTPVCLSNQSWYEIIVDDKKIAAAAQKRLDKKILQHGPILIDLDHERLCSVFRKKDKKVIDRVKKRIASVSDYKKISVKNLKKELIKYFEKDLKITFIKDSLSKEEKDHAKKLIKEKYSKRSWLLKY